jgi:hypothetical protein
MKGTVEWILAEDANNDRAFRSFECAARPLRKLSETPQEHSFDLIFFRNLRSRGAGHSEGRQRHGDEHGA